MNVNYIHQKTHYKICTHILSKPCNPSNLGFVNSLQNICRYMYFFFFLLFLQDVCPVLKLTTLTSSWMNVNHFSPRQSLGNECLPAVVWSHSETGSLNQDLRFYRKTHKGLKEFNLSPQNVNMYFFFLKAKTQNIRSYSIVLYCHSTLQALWHILGT